MSLALTMEALPVRRIVRSIVDVAPFWQRVAVLYDRSIWVWDCGHRDHAKIVQAVEAGRMVTVWEPREDDVIWLLVRRA